jgi:hypothetical protein
VYAIDNIQPANKDSYDKIENCCEEYPAAFVATYTSGHTWVLCPYCDSLEAFKLGLTSRTRISK